REVGGVWLREAHDVRRYLLAAEARRANRPDAAELARGLDGKRLARWVAALEARGAPPEDPLEPWRVLAAGNPAGAAAWAASWGKFAERYAREGSRRSAFNEQRFVPFAD